MARRSTEELLTQAKIIIGDNSSDEVIAFFEDITDTTATDGKDWESEYNKLDQQWRERYLKRFSDTTVIDETENRDNESSDNEDDVVEIKDLFKEVN